MNNSLIGFLAAAILLLTAQAGRAQDVALDPVETLRGITYYQQGDNKRAVTALQEAVRLDPRDADAWHYLGLALRNDGKRAAAADALREAVERRFQRFAWVRPANSRIGDLKVRLDERFAEAVESLEEFLRMKPDTEPVWRERLAAARFYAEYYSNKQGERIAYSRDEVERPVEIVHSPEPRIPPKSLGKGGHAIESVVLLVTYSAEGTVKHIITIQAASPEYTQAKIDAARRITFKPATIEGRPVSVVGTIY